MQHNLDFYDNHEWHDGDEFIQYKIFNHEHKMLVQAIATSQGTPYASITHNILALVSIVVSDAWL